MDIGKDLANAYEEGMRDARAKIDNEVFELQTEVKRLERICHSYALQYGTVKDQQAVIDKAKAEVAREMLEEIEKKSCVISETNHSTVATRVVCYQISAERIAKLKKKYVEGDYR